MEITINVKKAAIVFCQWALLAVCFYTMLEMDYLPVILEALDYRALGAFEAGLLILLILAVFSVAFCLAYGKGSTYSKGLTVSAMLVANDCFIWMLFETRVQGTAFLHFLPLVAVAIFLLARKIRKQEKNTHLLVALLVNTVYFALLPLLPLKMSVYTALMLLPVSVGFYIFLLNIGLIALYALVLKLVDVKNMRRCALTM